MVAGGLERAQSLRPQSKACVNSTPGGRFQKNLPAAFQPSPELRVYLPDIDDLKFIPLPTLLNINRQIIFNKYDLSVTKTQLSIAN